MGCQRRVAVFSSIGHTVQTHTTPWQSGDRVQVIKEGKTAGDDGCSGPLMFPAA
jgi:hypothetical protein